MAQKGGNGPSSDMASFHQHLRTSDRILALLGAGLSASSGLPTFRGAGGIWRNHEAVSLATPEAFEADPALVWQFYGARRHMALKSKPNKAHYALAELARRKPNFITLSQNVDGLSPRANHPALQLHLLHGSLFDSKCSGFYCAHVDRDNFADPIVPALAIPTTGPQPEPSATGDSAEAGRALVEALKHASAVREVDISNAANPLPVIAIEELPRCPHCHNLLRPGVVWFGESLPRDVLDAVDSFIAEAPHIDLILVVGTSAQVFPAAGFIDQARAKGARIAVVNMESDHIPQSGLSSRDWFFQGDAAVLVPEMLQGFI